MSTSDPQEFAVAEHSQSQGCCESLGAAGNSGSALQGGYGVVFPCQD